MLFRLRVLLKLEQMTMVLVALYHMNTKPLVNQRHAMYRIPHIAFVLIITTILNAVIQIVLQDIQPMTQGK